jgi:hypothetical protein
MDTKTENHIVIYELYNCNLNLSDFIE